MIFKCIAFIKRRATHATEENDNSSRSHAICQIFIRDKETNTKIRGKLTLVNLAGSERSSNAESHNFQRGEESLEINTSLLVLKECIRALDNGRVSSVKQHVPCRASKLTMVLKDCFSSYISVIAAAIPGTSSTDYTLNTLRYVYHLKRRKGDDEYNLKLESKSLKNKNNIFKSKKFNREFFHLY